LAFRFPWFCFAHRAGSARPAPTLVEALESRLALYADPFLATAVPALSALKNTNDTVVRMQTNQGVIDIELYDRGGPPATVTAANFLAYINSGRYDNTFFHRSITSFVLQGGGFVDDPTTSPQYAAVVTDPAIVNEYSDSRKNIKGTIAMAKLGGDPNSATSQFFFNLTDNPDLDTQNGGFTVFGQVIGGWSIIETIAGFQTRDLNQFLGGDAFGQVPLYGPNNTDLIRIIDIEVIKPAEQTQFYTQTISFPDGFRSGRIVSTVEMVNLDANAETLYQIIVRYETKTRDTVVASGKLAAGAHLEVPISKAGQPSLNKVKAVAPFSYIIRSTTKVAATLHHKDFGAVASEGFFNAEPFTESALKNWSFAGAQRGAGIASYIEWENLSGDVASVTVFISPVFPDTWAPVSVTKSLQPYRRGGLDISQIANVPEGLLTLRLVSDKPVVAALSQYRAAPARASIELGVPGLGNIEGILPAAFISSSGQAVISIARTDNSQTAITIDLQFILSDGSIFSNNGTLTLTTTVQGRRWDISTLNGALPRDEYFSIRYKVRSSTAPVAVTYFSIVDGDAIATAFQTASSKELAFGDGFSDFAATEQGDETISIFNPFAAGSLPVVNYRVRFHFVDGTSDEIVIPAAGNGTLNSSRRVDLRVRDLPEIVARVNSDTKYRHYSISISADITSSSVSAEGAIFAQLTRIDPSGDTMTSAPTLNAGVPIFFADNSIFGAP